MFYQSDVVTNSFGGNDGCEANVEVLNDWNETLMSPVELLCVAVLPLTTRGRIDLLYLTVLC